jgi:hypothetical protein
MRELESDHPWASTVDLQIYLEGFDKGEQFAFGNFHKLELARDAWDTPNTAHQEINASNGHTSDDTPAAIAGVIRKDE